MALSGVDRISAELDVESVGAVVVGGSDQLLALLLGHLPAGDGHGQGRGRDLAVLGEPDLGVLVDVLDPLGLREERLEPLGCRRRVGEAGRILGDRVDLLAGVPTEARLGDVAGRLRVRVRRVVVGVEIAGEAGAHADDQDHRGDPAEDHLASVAIGDVS
jgi:hypothetical protein